MHGWLDGEEQAARKGYAKQKGVSRVTGAYCAQVNDIETACPELECLYGDRVVRTLTSGSTGSTYLSCPEIVSIMLADDAEGMQ